MDGAMQFADPAVEDLTEDLSALVRDWGLREVRPRVRELEASGEFPRELYRDMGQLGFFGCCFPEAMGGTGAGYAALAAVAEQLAWVYPPLSAAMNLQAATVPLTIANWGSDEMVQRYVPGLLAGQLLGCNAMTEPDGGSDFLGAMRTRARRQGDDFVLDGAKMWITNANVADVAVVYAKTDPELGHRGVTAFVVPTDSPGFSTTRVPCRVLGSLMPTNAVALDGVRVPARNLLGEVGQGFVVAMTAMDYGRLSVASRSGRPGSGLPRRLGGVRDAARGVRGEDRLVPDDQEADRRHGLRRRSGPRARSGGSPRLRHGHGRDAGQLGREVLRRRGRQPGGPGGSGDLRRRGVQRRSTDQPLSQLRQAVADRRGVGQHPGAADRG